MKSSAKKPASAKTKTDTVALLIATKKGGFILSSDNKRRRWDIKGPIFLGNIVHHMALDPREGRAMLMAAKTGHLGPTVFRSRDFGKTAETPGNRSPDSTIIQCGRRGPAGLATARLTGRRCIRSTLTRAT